MKITDITVQLVQSDCGRRWTHVYVHTDEGLTGIGETTYPRKEEVVVQMVMALKPQVIDKDPFDIEGLYTLLAGAHTAGRMTGEIFTSAISGIDQALWDLKGKALNAPVCALLGGPRTAKVPVYAHFGGREIEAMVDKAQSVLAEGFNAVKSNTCKLDTRGSRITREGLRNIDRRYAALRKALGEEVELMDDVHGVFDPQTALEIARVLEPYRLLFFEEPTVREDPEAYAYVRRDTSTPIAGSERLTGKKQFNDFFRAGAVDVAQPDIAHVGGITETKKICALAETYQVAVAPHNTRGPVGIMAVAHIMAAIPNALIQEFIAPSWIPWRNDILKNPLVLEDSCLVVPNLPGLGVEFDEEALKPHIVA